MKLLLAALLFATPTLAAAPQKPTPVDPPPSKGDPLTATELRQALGGARPSLEACAVTADVKGRVTATIEVLADGSVKKLELAPELSPAFTDCAKKVLGHLKLRGERSEKPKSASQSYYLRVVPPPG